MKRVFIREEVCMGCHLCEVYCQIQHSACNDPVKVFRNELLTPLPRLRVEERYPVSFSVHCRHCSDAPCVSACLTGALGKNMETGAVTVDESRCIGCWTCLLVCPLGAIKRDTGQKMIIKCDLCNGKDIPVCVEQCPNEALVYQESIPVDTGIPDQVTS